jgi:hypothetical protein
VSPIRKPSTEPRAIGNPDARHSARLGNSSRSFGVSTRPTTLALGVDRISPSPNSPTATGTMPMPPSWRCRRVAKMPVMLSIPIVLIRRLEAAINKVRMSEVDDI